MATPQGLYPLAHAVACGTVKLKDLPEAQRTKVSGILAALTPEALRATKAPGHYSGATSPGRIRHGVAR